MPETVIDAEFGPDKAGQRVGWVRVTPDIHDGDIVHLDATIATVGPEGAQSSHLVTEGQEVTTRNSHRGFEAAVTVGGLVLRNQITQSVNELRFLSSVPSAEADSYQGDANSLIGNQTPGHPNFRHRDKQWVEDEAAFLAVLKKQLVDNGVCAAYPGIYYMLNHTAAHVELMPEDASEDANLLMADPSQQGTTHMERARANVVAELLSIQRNVDDKMLAELNRANGMTTKRLVDDFVNSRVRITELEAEIGAAAQQLLGRNGVYLPVGQGNRKRAEPYMDATKANAEEAYGRELNAMKAGNYTKAQFAVMQETFELEGRRDYAFRGFDVLCRLASLEDALK